jgi:hypothetical protein
LLGQIKEEHKKEEKAGVVPNDLGFGLIMDLIDIEEVEKELKEKEKNKLTRKKTENMRNSKK